MDGMGGYEGWRWMFIVEGCLTMILGLLTWFILVDSPERSSSWLTPDEIRYLKIQGYVKEGGRTSDEPHGSKLTDFRSIICDWRFWAFGLMLHMSSACSYGKFTASRRRSTLADMARSQVLHAHHHTRNGLQQFQSAATQRHSVHIRRLRSLWRSPRVGHLGKAIYLCHCRIHQHVHWFLYHSGTHLRNGHTQGRYYCQLLPHFHRLVLGLLHRR